MEWTTNLAGRARARAGIAGEPGGKEEEHWVGFYVDSGVVHTSEDRQGVLENGELGGDDAKRKRERENASVQPQKRRKEGPKVESMERGGMLPDNGKERAQTTT